MSGAASDRVARGIVYSVIPGFRPLELDVHRPPDGIVGSAPVIVEVHGGGWLRGTRQEFIPGLSDAETFGRITAAGFAVVAPSYRLSGEAIFPAQIDDIRAALEWVARDGAAYGCDPSRVVLWGSSAGGTIAALLAMEPGIGVRGVVDWFGPSELISMAQYTREQAIDLPGESREDRWIGGWVLENRDAARAASPAHHVRPGAPPFHLAHGDADTDVPPSQAQALAAALDAAGVPFELTIVPGAGHLWRGVSPARIGELFDAAIGFAQRVIHPADHPGA